MSAQVSPATIAMPVTESGRLQLAWRHAAGVLPVVFPLLLAALSLELWVGLGRTNAIPSADRACTWLLVTATLVFWLLAVSILAGVGFYRAIPMAIPVGVPVFSGLGLLLVARLPHIAQLLEATPPTWLIGTMVVRLAGGVFLAAIARGGVAKPWFAAWGGSLDVFVGVTALPPAWWGFFWFTGRVSGGRGLECDQAD